MNSSVYSVQNRIFFKRTGPNQNLIRSGPKIEKTEIPKKKNRTGPRFHNSVRFFGFGSFLLSPIHESLSILTTNKRDQPLPQHNYCLQSRSSIYNLFLHFHHQLLFVVMNPQVLSLQDYFISNLGQLSKTHNIIAKRGNVIYLT